MIQKQRLVAVPILESALLTSRQSTRLAVRFPTEIIEGQQATAPECPLLEQERSLSSSETVPTGSVGNICKGIASGGICQMSGSWSGYVRNGNAQRNRWKMAGV